ncbi:MAG: branched-chain amino acid ABC transporter permease [Deltaproteobacteria bacterium]|nr:MAG: branched-chain amino acid ABC transporter permease [Deltaproteobacteria bacterium]
MFAIRVHKRQVPLPWWGTCFVLCGAVLISLGMSAGLLALQGKPALDGILLFLQSGFGTSWAMQDCLAKAVPIFLCSLGVAITFKLQVWNIGAEGQYALGSVGATWAALTFPDLPWYFLLPVMLLGATILGGIWGLIPALLRIKLRVNEIIVTLMLNYIGILVLEYLVYGPWKDPASFGMPMTPTFSDNAIVGCIGATAINWGIGLCVLTGILMTVFLTYTRYGFALKACGENPRAAAYAHLPYTGLVIMVMVVSGALAGWAGFLEASASLNRLEPTIMAGYGYTAIVVAWLARLNPLAIGAASFLLAGLRVGVEGIQLDLQVPAAFGGVMEGLILLTILAGSFWQHYTITRSTTPRSQVTP